MLSFKTYSIPGIMAAAVVLAAALPAVAAGDNVITELVPGTAVLLDQSTRSGSGGNATSTSSSTNIFAPAAFVDYKRFGGEPSLTVDRYPFSQGQFGCTSSTGCAPRDIVYQSAPNGFVFPHYSQFWKSDDRGGSFRKPQQIPISGQPIQTAGGGGGDSHQAVGSKTHNVYEVDLTLFPGITVNRSTDLGDSFDQSDPFGAGLAFLDDRQWMEADEDVNTLYLSTINLLNLVTPTLAVYRNTTGAPLGGWATSPCEPATFAVGSSPLDPSATDGTPTPCADPADPYLWVAGPVVADNEGIPTRLASHNVYVPFIRRISEPLGTGLFGIDAWQLFIAKSTDHGLTWTRHKVADLPNTVNPANIFPQMTIDRGGNLYYTWSQAQGASTKSGQGKHTDPGDPSDTAGEQDIYYTFSRFSTVPPLTGAAGTWAAPINLTPSANDSAIFPWMVAGDPGRVDVVYYKSNSGINSNIQPSTTVWNVYFGQSQNALNTGSNFSTVQVSTQPNHLGLICTGGLGCNEDRDLLDFFTVDIDHFGAAHIAYGDDNRRRNSDEQDYMTRQIAGNSVFKDQNITLQSSWPIRDHTVYDRPHPQAAIQGSTSDVYDATSTLNPACKGMGMDILTTSASRSDDKITITMTLDGPPTAANATVCGKVTSDGGIWGAEFWAASNPTAAPPANTGPSNRFYIAYRDDAVSGQRVEGGTVDSVNATITALEYTPRAPGTLGGTCLPAGGPPAIGTCTITMTVSSSGLGITPGNGLYNITGLTLYFFGDANRPPGGLVRLILGNSEQADATAALHYLGSGTP